MSEFDLIEERLRAYRPVGPSPAARDRMAAVVGGTQAAASGRPRPSPWLWVAAAAAVLALFVFGTYAVWRWLSPGSAVSSTASGASGAETPIPEEFATSWAAQRRVDIPGISSRAAVTVVMFMDWPCPGCLKLYPTFELIAERYKRSHPGLVDFVVLDWPWNGECNPYVPAEVLGHEASCVAAAAVRIARSRGQADAMIEWILTNRAALEGVGWRDRILTEIRRLFPGIDFEQEYQKVLGAIENDAARGAAVGVNATPTIFVNGRLLGPGIPPVDAIDWAIRLELERKVKGK